MSVSIIIPFYNSEKFIDNTLKSIVNQSLRNIEILCINDGSTDRTLEILQRWQTEDGRMVIVDKENGGVETGLKAALPYISKDYVFLIGHDDTLSVDALEKAVTEITKEESYDAVRLKLVLVYEDESKEDFKDNFTVLTGKDAVSETIMKWGIHNFCLWKTKIFKEIDNVTTGRLMNFDEVATRFLYTKCRKVSFCDGRYFYFQHPESVTHKFTPKLLDVYAADFYIKKLLIEADIYHQFKVDFEVYMLRRLNLMMHLYFNLKKQNYPLSKTDIDKIRFLYSAIDFKFLNQKRSFLEKIKYGLVYFSFNNYFFYKKQNYGTLPD